MLRSLDFQPRWRNRYIHCTSSHNQKRAATNLKTKKQPELPENRTVWEPDNQGVKEETFTQTGRRGGGRQLVWRELPARQRLVEQAVPHLHADKLGGITGDRDSPHNPVFQSREVKPQNL